MISDLSTLNQIRDCALDVQVMDFDTVGRNELIGKVLLACE